MVLSIFKRVGGSRRLVGIAPVGPMMLWLMSTLTGPIADCQTLHGVQNESDTAEMLSEALVQQHAGKNSVAGTILLKALSRAPESPRLLDALGSVQQDLGEYSARKRVIFTLLLLRHEYRGTLTALSF